MTYVINHPQVLFFLRTWVTKKNLSALSRLKSQKNESDNLDL